MANRYVSTNGISGDWSYSTTGNYYTTVTAACSAAVAGDVIYIASDFVDADTGASKVINPAGTATAPTLLVSWSRTTDVYQAGARIVTTGNRTLTIGTNYGISAKGISFEAGDGTTTASLTFTINVSERAVFTNCSFVVTSTSSAANIVIGRLAITRYSFYGCTFKFNGHTSQYLSVGNSCLISFTDCVVDCSATVITSLLVGSNNTLNTSLVFSNCDFSQCDPSTFSFIRASQVFGATVDVINCKFPSSTTATVCAGTMTQLPQARSRGFNLSYTGGKNIYEVKYRHGMIQSDTGVYRNLGATEGAQGISWLLTSQADASELGYLLKSDVITIPCDTTGTKTVTVEFASDTDFTDNELFIEASTIDAFVSSKTSANTTYSTGTGTWAGTAKTYYKKMTVSIPVTVAGNVYVTVFLCKPSSTVNIDYKAYLT